MLIQHAVRASTQSDLAIIVDRPGFVMGFAERDGQEFELVHLSEATATAYFSENRDAAAQRAGWRIAARGLIRAPLQVE